MKNDNNIRFAELLEKRKKLSRENKEKINKVFDDDSQLKDIINNFNESYEYAKIKMFHFDD